MLIGDGGGGTDWSSMSMDTMRLLIKTPDTAAYYDMLDGWKHSYELLDAHRWQIESYRDALAVAWPPDKSEAALAYVGRLNEMLANLDQTYEAALQNHRAFADAALSIGLAQSDFDRIDQEFASNQAALNAFESKMAQDTTATERSTPPVAEGRQEELRLSAAARLSSVSTDLAQAQAQIRQPVKYNLRPGIEMPGTPQDEHAYVPPSIPPITPRYLAHHGIEDQSKSPSITLPTDNDGVGHSGPLPVTTQPVINPRPPGLILGGTDGPVARPPTVVAPPIADTGAATGPLTNTPLPAGASPLLPPAGTSSGARRPQVPPSGRTSRPAGTPEGVMGAVPPGGVIGSSPGRSFDRPGPARPELRRINPIGGIIGEGDPGARASDQRSVPLGGEPMVGGRALGGRADGPDSRRMSAAARSTLESERPGGTGARDALHTQPHGRPNSRNSPSENADGHQHWDPDNPWEVAEGVDPLLMPPREQRIDPGPVIGLH